MKVILLQDVKSLGKKGEIVNVSEGYARNMLLPKKLGVEANNKNLNDLKLQNQHADKVAQENLEAAQAMAKKIEDWLVETKIKTGEGGRTFGSVSSKEICAAVKSQYNETIDKKKEEELTAEEKNQREELSKKVVTLRDERNERLRQIGEKDSLVRQIIDLALLTNGMLKGKNLTEFIQRSISLIEK